MTVPSIGGLWSLPLPEGFPAAYSVLLQRAHRRLSLGESSRAAGERVLRVRRRACPCCVRFPCVGRRRPSQSPAVTAPPRGSLWPFPWELVLCCCTGAPVFPREEEWTGFPGFPMLPMLPYALRGHLSVIIAGKCEKVKSYTNRCSLKFVLQNWHGRPHPSPRWRGATFPRGEG